MKRTFAFSLGLLFTIVLLVRLAVAQPQSMPGGIDDAVSIVADAGPLPTPLADGGAPAAAAKDTGPSLTRVELQGYVNVGVGMTGRPGALPRDRITYGLRSSVAGIILRGNPFEHFSYTVHFGINPEAIRLVTDVDLVNVSGDGRVINSTTRGRRVTFVPVEEVSIAYAPIEELEIKAGHFYMPFSPGAAVLITSQMFPTRPGPTQIFMTGADQGIMTSAALLDRRILFALGAYNGSSLGLALPQTTALGPAYSFFFDVHPLGKMPRVEGDPNRGPFRFALGGGAIYRTGVLFDTTGYESTRFREVRLDAAVRASFLGVFLQGEVLRRLQTDELSLRPLSATGAYVQGSYFQPLGDKIAIAPLARYGVVTQDEGFAPRTITEIEAGIAFYPRADLAEPNKLRFILQYDGEIRQPEDEIAHGAVLHGQLRW